MVLTHHGPLRFWIRILLEVRVSNFLGSFKSSEFRYARAIRSLYVIMEVFANPHTETPALLPLSSKLNPS